MLKQTIEGRGYVVKTKKKKTFLVLFEYKKVVLHEQYHYFFDVEQKETYN